MITLRKSEERGRARLDWLESWHTFSFDQYRDPEHMGFRSLRVINEDRVKPGVGFPLHRHENMEVITFIVKGQLKHEDDSGGQGIIGPGEVQRFSAGTGIRHSEFNPSAEEEVHLLQIWILPERKGLSPGYEQKRFDLGKTGRLILLGSRDGRENSVTIHQDVDLYYGAAADGQSLDFSPDPGRHAWIQVIDGALEVNGIDLSAGDGGAINEESLLNIKGVEEGSFLLFDLK